MRDVIFPSGVGVVVRGLRAGYAAAGLEVGWVRPKLPTEYGMPLQDLMTTVRDDSGPDDGPLSRRRHGVNLWGTDVAALEQRALRAMAICRSLADGKPIVATDQFSGPFEVDDQDEDRLALAGGARLFHYFFTFRVSVRGTNA